VIQDTLVGILSGIPGSLLSVVLPSFCLVGAEVVVPIAAVMAAVALMQPF
jgi:hypothetical protein